MPNTAGALVLFVWLCTVCCWLGLFCVMWYTEKKNLEVTMRELRRKRAIATAHKMLYGGDFK